MHWLELGLGQQSVSFMPKPFNQPLLEEEARAKAEGTGEKFPDPVVKNGLLTNVYNRIIRTAFYTAQKLNGGEAGILPTVQPEENVLADAKKAVLEYERHMAKFAFHQCTYVLDGYIRSASKYLAKALKPEEQSAEEIQQVLANLFYMIRIAAVLLHPMAPFGTEKLREYLDVDERIWSWETLLEPLTAFTGTQHKLKYLPPRTDFFARHESQFEEA
jgi:methionyl-tRNA synthetase